MSMDRSKTVQGDPSVAFPNNRNNNANTFISDNSQLKTDFTMANHEDFQSSENFVGYQTNFSSHKNLLDDLNDSMSRLTVQNVQPMNQGNSTRFGVHPYQPISQLGAPSTSSSLSSCDTQAQLVAFTPSLMSIRFPRREHSIHEQNHYQRRSYMHNQLHEPPPLSTQGKPETVAAQPEYYIDSFASNFSDKPSSNSNIKPKTKHVTFQEPESSSSFLKSQSDNFTHTEASSNDVHHLPQHYAPPNHLYPVPRSSHQFYNPYQHPMHNQYSWTNQNWIANPRFINRARFVHPMPTSQLRGSQSFHGNHRATYTDYRFQPKQLYDPNKPKTPALREAHNVTNVIRNIIPKHKKKQRQAANDSNSSVSTSEPIPHPITILRKPTNSVQSNTEPVTILQPRSPSVKDYSIASLDELHTISTIDTNHSNSLCTEQSLAENIQNVPFTDERRVTSSTDKQSISQSTSNTIIPLSGPEILSILQSANCLSTLNDYAQQKNISLSYDFSSIPPSSFTCKVFVNGRDFPTSPVCSSKIEAQKMACDQALHTVYLESCMDTQTPIEFSNKHDSIAHQSVSKFQILNVNDMLLGRKTLACILMVIDEQYAQANVISIGTGNTCLNETNLAYADDGVVLHDCHAEVLARRGLIRYLFEQIQQCKETRPSIFEYNSMANRFQLQANVTFHLYISSTPCGCASFNMPSNSIRFKQGQTEGTVPASACSTKYSIKSCSDKIYRWNILGVQGGLLINLLAQPIYLRTITLACETGFDRDFVTHALCERVNEHIHALPNPFSFHIPDIDCPTIKILQKERQVAKLQPSAFAWNITRPDRMELLEPMTGKLKSDRSMSSLSKRNLFNDFTRFIQTHFAHDSSLSFSTYQQAKQLNKTYTTVKNLISEAFAIGTSDDENVSWLSKSDQVEQFSIE